MKKINLGAFTLVELIVVITIVGILSTVGFVSYSGYLAGARDSNRISQMVKLSDSLQVYSTTKTLPLPDNYVEVNASGSLIAYQGEVGVDVLETIDYTNGGADPKDDSYYTYYLTKNRRSMQLMAMMEEQQSVAQVKPINITASYAADFTDRFPKVYGRKLGILTEIDTNTPIHQLSVYTATPFDVVSETSQFISHISDDEKLEGTGSTLQTMISDGSCKRIKQTGGASGNGIYTINPGGTGNISAYCDMETNGGGWTLVARSVSGATGNFGWDIQTGGVKDDTQPYSMGTVVKEIPYEYVIYSGYSSKKEMANYGFLYSTTDDNLESYLSDSTFSASCETIISNDGGLVCGDLQFLGNYDCTTYYNFDMDGGNCSRGLGIGGNYHTHTPIVINGMQGMVFVK